MKKLIKMKKYCLLLFLIATSSIISFGQDTAITNGFNDLVKNFFEYDRQKDLNVKVKLVEETEQYKKQKIVFDGIRDNRVPGYIATPNNIDGPLPCILLFHSGIGSKDVWWEEGRFEHGKLLLDELIAAGYAVLMLDAQYHGERKFGNDYESSTSLGINAYREQMLQTTIEYRIALDYLATREDIDMAKIGAFGTSVGANMILALTTVDPRLKTMVICSTIMHNENFSTVLSVFDPIHARPSSSEVNLLVQVGKTDGASPEAKVNKIFEQWNASQKSLKWYEFGHRPDMIYIPDAVNWFKKHL